MKISKHSHWYIPCDINQTNVEKLGTLAEMETSLFGNSPEHRENREAYLFALDKLSEELLKKQVTAFRFRDDLTVGTGKEYFDKYLQFQQIIHSDHQGLQRLKTLLADGINFRYKEIDRYACGSDFGSCERLYIRSTPAEEIIHRVSSGPNILDQVALEEWSPMAIWELYLLRAADDWILLNWHALYRANDIICQDHWKPVPPPWQDDCDKEIPYPDLAEGYTIPYPSVYMTDEYALIHYVCHWQHDNRYEDMYVVVTRWGDTARFEVCSEPNTKILNVQPVDRVLY